jgi:hypothetical protein
MPSPYPEYLTRRMFMSGVRKGDAEQVREWVLHGADVNQRTRSGRPPIVVALTTSTTEASVVKALLDNGADPGATDALGMTALDHARRRLAKYEGRPRRPVRRSRFLTAGGELNLSPREWAHIEAMEAKYPGFSETYLVERRKVAERVFDTRGNLERIVALLEGMKRSAS